MTRRFWAGLMLVALLLAGGSTYLLLEKMAEPPPQPVRLKNVPPPKPAPAVAASTAPAVTASSETAKPAEAKATGKTKRNILFRLAGHSVAKEVAIIGDFNNWKRQALKKDAKGWTLSVPLAPGRYEYAYVVDGKRYRDPNNRQSASGGRVSVLIVKPLAKP